MPSLASHAKEDDERYGEQQAEYHGPVGQSRNQIMAVPDEPHIQWRGKQDRVQDDDHDDPIEHDGDRLDVAETRRANAASYLVVFQNHREEETTRGGEHPCGAELEAGLQALVIRGEREQSEEQKCHSDSEDEMFKERAGEVAIEDEVEVELGKLLVFSGIANPE